MLLLLVPDEKSFLSTRAVFRSERERERETDGERGKGIVRKKRGREKHTEKGGKQGSHREEKP